MKIFFELKKFGLVILTGMIFVHLAGCSNPAGYPIDPNVSTTLERTIVPGPNPLVKIRLDEISKYDQYGYGKWTFGAPLKCVTRTDIMPAAYKGLSATKKARLLKFFTISDIHITDKEAPNQAIFLSRVYKAKAISAALYSGGMLYSTQVLDAAIQTVNALHKKSPFDFGLSLGDAANSTQYNELRWYIDVIDGKVINPSSGAHLGAGNIEYQKPFKAAGLDRSIPWYQAIGNHDHFWIGSIPVDYGPRKDLRQSYISSEVIAMGDILRNPANINSPDYYMGVVDGSTPNGNVKYAGPVADFKDVPKVAADPNRRSLLRNEWMKEFFKTSTNPAGHGFNKTAADKGFACYSFVTKSSVLPVKVIVLDDTQKENDRSYDVHGHGFLDQARWAWLKKELADGDAAGQLMIIAAHVPIGVEVTAPRSEMGWWTDPQNAVTLPGLITELQSHPNFLMWISGHRHLNTVKAFRSPDSNAPEKGFWEVETSSLRDFPQQLRTFEIYLNNDNTVSIITTNVDPSVKEGTPAARSRKYAVAAEQITGADIYNNNPTKDPSIKPMPTASYNAELIKQLSPEMRAKLK